MINFPQQTDTAGKRPPVLPNHLPFLTEIGFSDHDARRIQGCLHKRGGLVICCGPPKSGLTTSLNRFTSQLAGSEKKTIVFDNGRFEESEWVTRVPITNIEDVSLPLLIRSALGMGADIAVIPSIDQQDVFNLAMRAALMQQMVFTRVPATSTIEALHDLQQRNPFEFPAFEAVRLLILQKLVPRLCPACREQVKLRGEDAAYVTEVKKHFHPPELEKWQFFQSKGCDHCQGTGFLGQQLIAETLVRDDELLEAIREGCTQGDLREMAMQKGTRHLAVDGLEKAAAGLLTIKDLRTAAPHLD